MHPIPFSGWASLAAAVLFAALGAWVLFARRRDAGNIAFAVYALGSATVSVLIFAEREAHWIAHPQIGKVYEGLWVLIGLAVLVLAVRLPIPVARRDALPLLAAGALGAALLALRVSPWDFYTAALWAAAFAIAFRWRSYETADQRRAAALVSAALAIYHATQRGTNLGAVAVGLREFDLWLAVQSTVPFLLAAAWLALAARGGGRTASIAAWLVLGAVLSGMLTHLGPDAFDALGHPATRTVGFTILAYTIVRHQLLGATRQLRWAVSKSTLAAVFIAVFFVASEVAQQFFGEQLQSTYLGILAAGALVFAIAPLSRVADRLAERAVPTPARADADAEALYLRSVRHALRDGRLTRDDELHLGRLAERLGIGAGRATELRHEAETETPG